MIHDEEHFEEAPQSFVVDNSVVNSPPVVRSATVPQSRLIHGPRLALVCAVQISTSFVGLAYLYIMSSFTNYSSLKHMVKATRGEPLAPPAKNENNFPFPLEIESCTALRHLFFFDYRNDFMFSFGLE